METGPPSARFEALAARLREGESPPLAEAALALAAEFGPVDEPAALRELERLGARAAGLLGAGAEGERLGALLDFLHREAGFCGNERDYGDPRNSDLGQVLARRTGIPITLAIVAIEVGARAGLRLEGVSFPGHFLVRTPAEPPTVGDAFHGRVLDRDELARRLRAALGPAARLEPGWLRPASARDILVRMLNNLKQLRLAASDWLGGVGCCDRILLLAPELLTERRDRGLLYERLACFHAAAEDLARYLAAAPDAPEADALRGRLAALRAREPTVH